MFVGPFAQQREHIHVIKIFNIKIFNKTIIRIVNVTITSNYFQRLIDIH